MLPPVLLPLGLSCPWRPHHFPLPPKYASGASNFNVNKICISLTRSFYVQNHLLRNFAHCPVLYKQPRTGRQSEPTKLMTLNGTHRRLNNTGIYGFHMTLRLNNPFLTSNFRRVLNVVFLLLGASQRQYDVSEHSFCSILIGGVRRKNIFFQPSPPMMMEQSVPKRRHIKC